MNSPKFYYTRIGTTNYEACNNWWRANHINERTGHCKWDNDSNGDIKIADYIGFITGEIYGKIVVKIFKVEALLPQDQREEWWTESNRLPIQLTSNHELPTTWDWFDFKQKLGLAPNCYSWMPRGTKRVKNAHLLPFANPFTPDVVKAKKPAKEAKKLAKNGLELIKKMY